jgi:hypothetical protein
MALASIASAASEVVDSNGFDARIAQIVAASSIVLSE